MPRLGIVVVVLCIGLAAVLTSGLVTRARVSRLGGSLYYVEGDHLVRHDLRRDKTTVIIALREHNARGFVVRSNYSVSRDGRRIAYVESYSSRRDLFPSSCQLVVAELPLHRALFRRSGGGTSLSRAYLSLSPNGRYLAVVQGGTVTKASTLDVVNVCNGKPCVTGKRACGLTANPPSWDPSSRYVAYEDYWQRPVCLDTLTGDTRALPGNGEPLWSPDGALLATSKGCLISVKTMNRRRVALPERAAIVGWSPDSRQLLCEMPSELSGGVLYAYSLESARLLRLPISTSGMVAEPTLWLP